MSPNTSTRKARPTGPRTPEGKAKASLNALRHGLTGRVVVLPSEDLASYQAFCAELIAELAPETPVERQYAQTFCDTQWRLNRIRSIEDSMFSLGVFEAAGEIDPGHSQIHAALANARLFRENSKVFVNLSLYEQRLQRTLKESLLQLEELQAKRLATRQAAAESEAAESGAVPHNLHKMKGESVDSPADPPDSRFVFSTSGIDAEARGAGAENAQRTAADTREQAA